MPLPVAGPLCVRKRASVAGPNDDSRRRCGSAVARPRAADHGSCQRDELGGLRWESERSGFRVPVVVVSGRAPLRRQSDLRSLSSLSAPRC